MIRPLANGLSRAKEDIALETKSESGASYASLEHTQWLRTEVLMKALSQEAFVVGCVKQPHWS